MRYADTVQQYLGKTNTDHRTRKFRLVVLGRRRSVILSASDVSFAISFYRIHSHPSPSYSPTRLAQQGLCSFARRAEDTRANGNLQNINHLRRHLLKSFRAHRPSSSPLSFGTTTSRCASTRFRMVYEPYDHPYLHFRRRLVNPRSSGSTCIERPTYSLIATARARCMFDESNTRLPMRTSRFGIVQPTRSSSPDIDLDHGPNIGSLLRARRLRQKQFCRRTCASRTQDKIGNDVISVFSDSGSLLYLTERASAHGVVCYLDDQRITP
jgi:hypothetical protein